MTYLPIRVPHWHEKWGLIEAYPRWLLLFVLDLPMASVLAAGLFDAAEGLEFRVRQYDRAIAVAEELSCLFAVQHPRLFCRLGKDIREERDAREIPWKTRAVLPEKREAFGDARTVEESCTALLRKCHVR